MNTYLLASGSSLSDKVMSSSAVTHLVSFGVCGEEVVANPSLFTSQAYQVSEKFAHKLSNLTINTEHPA
jgi:hypothetical protein